ncbi:unnamed protein product [Protopolystoma xenopodis]|uniref:Uncharacterized protein n=1 Tax=Protopolystoma xenopodis TaxID=117903 RepID=A0A448WLJ6_9PLAT|nr:unnamed protein product [Protopolystoma xenopodis]
MVKVEAYHHFLVDRSTVVPWTFDQSLVPLPFHTRRTKTSVALFISLFAFARLSLDHKSNVTGAAGKNEYAWDSLEKSALECQRKRVLAEGCCLLKTPSPLETNWEGIFSISVVFIPFRLR